MKNKSIDKNVVILLISTLTTIVIWVGFEVYRAYFKVTLPTGLEKHLQPLTPSLRTDVFERLEERMQ